VRSQLGVEALFYDLSDQSEAEQDQEHLAGLWQQ
jgi:hypothetical protein